MQVMPQYGELDPDQVTTIFAAITIPRMEEPLVYMHHPQTTVIMKGVRMCYPS